MRRMLITALVLLNVGACGLPRDIVGPTDPRSGPPEQAPTPGG